MQENFRDKASNPIDSDIVRDTNAEIYYKTAT